MIISYIIPYYNGKKYIDECLDSLYAQGMQEDEFEVLMVDDCSTDEESLMVVRAYMAEHSNMRMLKNEYNMRVGASRNHGIKEAKGEYIWFVDQDDKIAPDCARRLLERMENEQLDVLVFDYLDFDDNGKQKPHRLITHNSDIMTGLEYAYTICEKQIWEHEWDTNVWHLIFRKSFIDRHNIRFTEVSYFDDMIVNLKSLMYAKRMKAIPEAYYHYRYNEQSVLHSEVGTGGRTLFDGTINAAKVLVDFSREIRDVDAYFSNHFMDAVSYRANGFTKALMRISHAEQKKFYAQVALHPDVVAKVKPYLSRLNRILVTCPWMAYVLHPFDKLYRKLR